eukprot:1299662-Rhodomonas_salina.1
MKRIFIVGELELGEVVKEFARSYTAYSPITEPTTRAVVVLLLLPYEWYYYYYRTSGSTCLRTRSEKLSVTKSSESCRSMMFKFPVSRL